MSTHAAGTFEIESWDEQPYEEQEGTRLARTRPTKTFSGDVEGESAAELLMAYGSEEGLVGGILLCLVILAATVFAVLALIAYLVASLSG